jgi:hypothetical protein
MKPTHNGESPPIVCPHCKKDLRVSHIFNSFTGPNGEPCISVLSFCGACKKPVPCSVFPVPMVRVRRDPASGGNRIVIPN